MSCKKGTVTVKATIHQLLSRNDDFDQEFAFSRAKFNDITQKSDFITLLKSAGAKLGENNHLINILRRSKKHRKFVPLENELDFVALRNSLKVKNIIRLNINDNNPLIHESNNKKILIDFAGIGDAFIEAALDHFKEIMSDFSRNLFEAAAPIDGIESSSIKPPPKNNVIHPTVSCDSCSPVNFVPLKGVRYSCLICPDFDLCETCESKQIDIGNHSHFHPLAKIIDPSCEFIKPRNLGPNNADIYYDIPLEHCSIETKDKLEEILNDKGIEGFFNAASKYIENSQRYEELINIANQDISPDDQKDDNLKFVVLKTLVEDALSRKSEVMTEENTSIKSVETEDSEVEDVHELINASVENDPIDQDKDQNENIIGSEHVVIRPKTFNQKSWLVSIMLLNNTKQTITGGDFVFDFFNDLKSIKVIVKNASSIKPGQARYYNLGGLKGMEEVDNLNIKIQTGDQTFMGVFRKDTDSILPICQKGEFTIDDSPEIENKLNNEDIVNVTLVPKSSSMAQVIINNKSSKVIDCSNLKLQVINCIGKSVVSVTIHRDVGILPNKHAKFNMGIINTHMKFPFRLVMQNDENIGEVELNMNKLSGNFRFNGGCVSDLETSETDEMEEVTSKLNEDLSMSNMSGSTRSIILPVLPKESYGESLQSSEYMDAENSLSKSIEKNDDTQDHFEEDYDIISVDEDGSASEFEMLSPVNFVQCRLDKLIRDMKSQIKEHHTEMEEQNLKSKCASLKRRISEVEENNEIATLALSRTKAAIRRLRLEYVILLERLEDRATKIPDGINSFEEMASPPTPNVLDDALIAAGLSRNGIVKKPTKKVKSSASNTNGNSNSSKSKARDPDLPKRPTNAYLIFCEMEKERIKQENEEKHPGMTNDLSKSMTEAWKNLPEEERKPYYKLYEDDRMRYQKEKAVYKQKKLAPSDEPEEQKVTKKKPENTASSQRTPEISDTKGADIELKDVTQQVDNDIAEEDQNDTEDVQMEPSSSQGLTVDSTHKDDTSPKK